MADTDILVSEMTPASQINTTDLMIMTQPDAQAETGYSTKSGTVLQVANKMLKETEYSTDLPDFTDKTPLGGLEELKADIKALLPISSASGNPCTFETNLADTLVSLIANITASGGGGTPATPIPIVGHSELNLVRCGKNFFDIDWFTDIGAERGTLTVSGESVTVTATSNDCYTNYVAARWSEDKRIKVKEGDVVRLRWEKSGATGRCGIFANGSTNIGFKTEDNSTGLVTYTIPAGCAFITIRLGVANAGKSVTYSNVMLTINDDTTAYAPYNGDTFTVAFGQTVYGGVYDKSGSLTINHATADEDTFTNYDGQTSPGGLHWVSATVDNVKNGHALCSMLEVKNTDAGWASTTPCLTMENGRLIIYTDRTSLADFKTYYDGLQIAYELATPIEIDVSELSVDTIVGVNNIISDCGGDVEVQYRDSIQHYIDSKIASVQALIL